MYKYIKHLAFNDQENHRGDRPGQFSIAMFLNEQSARQIYLLPVEMCMKVGGIDLNYLAADGNGGYKQETRPYRANQAIMTTSTVSAIHGQAVPTRCYQASSAMSGISRG